VTSGYDQSIKQCALYHLEDEWLGDTGHRVKIQFGANEFANPAACSVCGRDTTQAGFVMRLVSWWRQTSTRICLCDQHSAARQLHEVEVNIHQDNMDPRSGLS
jgi:hypothetical protein